jgi:hypothetical protein
MTKLALIPPIALLDDTLKTSYQLVLPHLLMTRSDYSDHYLKLAESEQHFVIMDNGEAEGQNNLEALELFQLAEAYYADEVVAPDSMKDMGETMERTAEFLDATEKVWENLQSTKRPVNIGIVAQGKSVHEVTKFVQYFVESDYKNQFTTIYLPRHLVTTLGDIRARITLARELNYKFRLVEKGYKVHFLGANHDAPVELMHLAQQVPWVRGMDTSMPFNYAFAGALLGEGHHPRPENYFNLTISDAPKPEYIDKNIDVMLRWARTPSLLFSEQA